MDLHPRALRALRRHVEREWPREAGGMIRWGGFFPLPNLHPEPERFWKFAVDDLEGVEAIVHSHPDGCTWPSRQDMESQIATGLPHGIVPVTSSYPEGPCLVKARGVAGELFSWPVADLPYLGRPYRHGVTDCYTLIRDWYRRERGLELPAVAYDWQWGERLDLYAAWRRRLGWLEVDPAAARPGDLVLLAIGSRVATHAGVLLEGGLLLHHPSFRAYDPTSLSRREPVSRLGRFVVEVARPPEPAA